MCVCLPSVFTFILRAIFGKRYEADSSVELDLKASGLNRVYCSSKKTVVIVVDIN